VVRDEILGVSGEAISLGDEKSGNEIGVVMMRSGQTMESIMWNLIGILYRAYCLARLREMRRFAHH